jgi:hypothetical protein
MKNIFKIGFCFSLLILNSYSQGQIVLDTTDLPAINEVQVTTIVDSSMAITLSPGNSGANINWDFSNLFYCCVDFKNYRWTDPQYSVHAAFFPESNIAFKTQCYLYHDWNTHIVTEICDNLDYFIKDTSGLKYIGSDYPVKFKTNTYRNVLPLLTYGQTKTNFSHIVMQKSVDSLFVRDIIDTMKADAWGTIITSFGTYNTIRIYTKEWVRDSLYVNGVGQLIRLMPNNYYYKWYAKGLGFPVFQINKGILETSPDYQIARVARYKYLETDVTEVSQTNLNCSVFPNPLTTASVLTFDLIKSSKVDITLSNLMGQNIVSITENFNQGINTYSLSALLKKELTSGIYLLSIKTTEIQKTLKLIKE